MATKKKSETESNPKAPPERIPIQLPRGVHYEVALAARMEGKGITEYCIPLLMGGVEKTNRRFQAKRAKQPLGEAE